MANPILKITDGTTTVNLLGTTSGLLLDEWTPSIAPLKGGGVYQQSVLASGRQLAMATFENTIETFSFKAWGNDQDATIRYTQELLRLLEKARSYWTNLFDMEPVWIAARAPNETNTRYAIIHNYQMAGLGNPYAAPFFACSPATMDGLDVAIERGHWGSLAPLESDPIYIAGSDGVNGQVTSRNDGGVFFSDKYNEAAISHIYVDDGGAFGANQVSSTAFSLFPAVPVSGDAVYFGIETSPSDTGPFNNLVFDIDTTNVQLTTVWEYYQGAPTSGWTAIPSKFDGTIIGFSTSGVAALGFTQPRDTTNGHWVTTAVNSVTGYWIRCRITAVGGSPQVPTTQNHVVYTATWGHIDVVSGAVGGDIPALAQTILEGYGGANDRYERVIMGIQSTKGPFNSIDYDFQAFIPMSDEQTPAILETPYTYWTCSIADDISAPSGRALLFNPATSPDDGYVRIISSTAHFMSRYKVFVRARQEGGVDDNFKVWLEVGYDDMQVYETTKSDTVRIQSTTTRPNWQLLELGEIAIPPDIGNRAADDVGDVILELNFEALTSTGDLYVMDLILIPVDEWFGDFKSLTTASVSAGSGNFFVDSIEQPKSLVRCVTKYSIAPVDKSVNPWKSIVTGELAIPANTDFKIWILGATWESSDDVHGSQLGATQQVWINSNQRYLGLRGAR